MSSANLRFIDVSFSYNTTSENIVSSLSTTFSNGWTGVCGPNGAGKSTIAKLASGLLEPVKGTITGLNNASCIYCGQEIEYPPDRAEDFLYASDNRSGELISYLGIGNNWIERWHSLSYGEKKRFHAGWALWHDPGILVFDEPTNHLDSEARSLIVESLKGYIGTGIVVSHDRELLDTLCSSTLFVHPGKIILRPGGFTAGSEQEKFDEKSAARKYEIASENLRRVKKSLNSLRNRESGRRGSLSKRNISKHDHDAKEKIDLVRLSGKDKTSAGKIKVMENRAVCLSDDLASKYVKIRKTDGFTYTGERLRGDSVALIHGGRIYIDKNRYIEIPDLRVLPSDRISITGNNGAGKSTLFRHIKSMVKIPDDKVIYISQEINSGEWNEINSDIDKLSGKDLGELLSVIYRLGSEPERILQTSIPSPGEMRKLVFGLGLLKTPSLIMMDEPTNHMDLPSVRCLENALTEFSGAIIIVSHDREFTRNTTHTRWHLIEDNGVSILNVVY